MVLFTRFFVIDCRVISLENKHIDRYHTIYLYQQSNNNNEYEFMETQICR